MRSQTTDFEDLLEPVPLDTSGAVIDANEASIRIRGVPRSELLGPPFCGQRLTVGRDLKMIDLRRQIEHLREHGPSDGGERGDEP